MENGTGWIDCVRHVVLQTGSVDPQLLRTIAFRCANLPWNWSCEDTVLDFLALACSSNRESSAELELSLCVRELYLSESPQS